MIYDASPEGCWEFQNQHIFFLYAWEEKDREDGRAMGLLEQVRDSLEVRLGPAQPHPISSRKWLPLSRK